MCVCVCVCVCVHALITFCTCCVVPGEQGAEGVCVLLFFLPEISILIWRKLKCSMDTSACVCACICVCTLTCAFNLLHMLWFQISKVQKKFDVCFSFSDGDEALVGQICSGLLKLRTNMVIHKEQLIYNHEEVWQEKIFDVMVHSHKLVYLLLLLFNFYFCLVV